MRSLEVLGPLIRDACAAASTARLEHDRRVGEALLEALGQVGVDEWPAWLRRHLRMSPKSALRYIAIAQDGGRDEDR